MLLIYARCHTFFLHPLVQNELFSSNPFHYIRHTPITERMFIFSILMLWSIPFFSSLAVSEVLVILLPRHILKKSAVAMFHSFLNYCLKKAISQGVSNNKRDHKSQIGTHQYFIFSPVSFLPGKVVQCYFILKVAVSLLWTEPMFCLQCGVNQRGCDSD